MAHRPAVVVLALLAAGRPLVANTNTAVPAAAEVQRLSPPLRDRAASIERQVQAVRDLAALGEPGVRAWRDHLDRELARLAAVGDARPPESAIDRQIAELRETLAGLRADPDLTKEKLERTGLPALEALEKASAARDKALRSWRTKQAAAHAQAERLAALVEACRDAAAGDPALGTAGPFDAGPAHDLATRLGPDDLEAARVLAENERVCRELPPEVAAGTKAVDSLRMLCGLRPLVIDTKLCAAATDHSADMEKHDFFAHQSPLPGRKEPWDRARLAGTTASAENIYMGGTSGGEAVKAWFLSPGHHKNLLGAGHRRQGLGRAASRWTQLFGD